MAYGQIGPARRQIDMTGLHRAPVCLLCHRHRRALAEQTRWKADIARMWMGHDHEGHSAVGRHVTEKLFHGFQPAGRRADPDDQGTGL